MDKEVLKLTLKMKIFLLTFTAIAKVVARWHMNALVVQGGTKAVWWHSLPPKYHCFNDISVNANLISVRLKSKRQRINTINFYLRDISTPLAGVVFKRRD